MTTYEIYTRNQPNADRKFEHITNTTSQPIRNQLIKELTKGGKTVVIIERYENGITCRSQYNPLKPC